MELAADTVSVEYKNDSNVDDNEMEAELQEEQEEGSVGEKLNWGLQQRAGSREMPTNLLDMREA
jgi:hypothetical protein